MAGRTYRYMTSEPLYPFGFGLSYARFEYADLKVSTEQVRKGDDLRVTATVRNVGSCRAEEVVQLYVTDVEASVRVPKWALKGFKRIALKPGQSQTVTFTITPEMMSLIDDNGATVLEPGQFRITVGVCSPGPRGSALGASQPAQAVFTVL
jgi:beta-glucosidase